MHLTDTISSSVRVKNALTGGCLDRVPIVEIVIDPKVAFALAPSALDMSDAFDKLGLDCISCCAGNLHVVERGEEYIDEWGVTYRGGEQVTAHPISAPLTDSESLARWIAPDPDAPHRLHELRETVARYGDDARYFSTTERRSVRPSVPTCMKQPPLYN